MRQEDWVLKFGELATLLYGRVVRVSVTVWPSLRQDEDEGMGPDADTPEVVCSGPLPNCSQGNITTRPLPCRIS